MCHNQTNVRWVFPFPPPTLPTLFGRCPESPRINSHDLSPNKHCCSTKTFGDFNESQRPQKTKTGGVVHQKSSKHFRAEFHPKPGNLVSFPSKGPSTIWPMESFSYHLQMECWKWRFTYVAQMSEFFRWESINTHNCSIYLHIVWDYLLLAYFHPTVSKLAQTWTKTNTIPL